MSGSTRILVELSIDEIAATSIALDTAEYVRIRMHGLAQPAIDTRGTWDIIYRDASKLVNTPKTRGRCKLA